MVAHRVTDRHLTFPVCHAHNCALLFLDCCLETLVLRWVQPAGMLPRPGRSGTSLCRIATRWVHCGKRWKHSVNRTRSTRSASASDWLGRFAEAVSDPGCGITKPCCLPGALLWLSDILSL